MNATNNPAAIVVPLLVLLPVLYFRMRRMSRARPLKLNLLWIRPGIFLVLGGIALAAPQLGAHGPNAYGAGATLALTPGNGVVLAIAALLGAVAGWYWGRTMAIEVHPEDGTLMVKGGQAAMLVLVVLIVMRMGLRYGAALEAEAWHLDLVLITDASIVFSVFLFSVRSVEMFVRARRVMAAAKTP